MTHITDNRPTDQCLELYLRTAIMMDAVLGLPPWWSVDQWRGGDVKLIRSLSSQEPDRFFSWWHR